MHELAIVEALIEQVEQEIRQAGFRGRARRLELSVGRLSGVNCASIRFAFELIAPSTSLKDAEIAIDEPKASCRCNACHGIIEIDDLVIQCPRCGSGDIIIEGGRDLLLQSIEIEDTPS
jgi:hydrogenase nickel incorporation protein HypA/HybF